MNKPLIRSDVEVLQKPGTVRALWNWLRGTNVEAGPRAILPNELRLARTIFRECRDGIGGEASARNRVAQIATLYRELNAEGRCALLDLLAEEFGPNERLVDRAIQEYLEAEGPARRQAESRLRLALASPRIRILKQFNLLPDGVKFLVDMRADLLRYLSDHPELEPLDHELFSLFGSWFDIGNLELRRITWNAPAMLLEKLIAYEAVHEIRSWSDLRKRLDSDRRCYAFFHPRMPDEPLIFVEIALTRGMADNVHELLDEAAPPIDPHIAQAAMFYSISNTQPGLRGVSFGGFLIKRVAEMLAADFPKLKTFATLSPLPGFRRWLDERLKAKDVSLFGKHERARLCGRAEDDDPYAAFAMLLVQGFATDGQVPEFLHTMLTRLCARYLVEAKEEEQDGIAHPLDPVARFHLGNGARLERINWRADTSSRGVKQSAGLMVNYVYKLDDIEQNHEAFAREGRVVVTDAVKRLLRMSA